MVRDGCWCEDGPEILRLEVSAITERGSKVAPRVFGIGFLGFFQASRILRKSIFVSHGEVEPRFWVWSFAGNLFSGRVSWIGAWNRLVGGDRNCWFSGRKECENSTPLPDSLSGLVLGEFSGTEPRLAPGFLPSPSNYFRNDPD